MDDQKISGKLFHIRKATEEDNKQLLDLIKNCPMKDGFDFFIDRSPDFFRLYSIQKSDYCLFVCEKNGNLVGSIGSIIKDVYIDGREDQVVLIGDLYILPEYRKGRLLPRLMSEIVTHNRKNVTLGISSYQEDNYNSISTTGGRLGFPKGEPLCEIKLYSLIHLFKLKVGRTFEFKRATTEEIPELVALYNEYYKKFDFAPRYTTESFVQTIEDIPEFSISNFYLCKRNGKIIAVSALWDASSVQNIVISNFNIVYKILSLLISLISFIPGYSKKCFKKGLPVQFLWHCFYAYKDGEEFAFKNLLKHVNNEIRKDKYLLTFITFDSNDTFNKYLKKFIKTEIKHKVFFFSVRENCNIKDFINTGRLKFIDYTFGI